MEGIKEKPRSNRPFGVKWHNIAEPAMNDYSKKVLSDLLKCTRVVRKVRGHPLYN